MHNFVILCTTGLIMQKVAVYS